jgi:hypothetical protein
MTKAFIGIDSGVSGSGVCIYEYSDKPYYGVEAVFNNKPFKEQLEWYTKWKKDAVAVVIEKVHGRGGWNANTNFVLGGSYQSCINACCQMDTEITYVTPTEWQQVFDLVGCVDSKAKNKTTLKKEKHRQRIEELFTTDFGITNRTVDAFLIAWYGKLKHYGEI